MASRLIAAANHLCAVEYKFAKAQDKMERCSVNKEHENNDKVKICEQQIQGVSTVGVFENLNSRETRAYAGITGQGYFRPGGRSLEGADPVEWQIGCEVVEGAPGGGPNCRFDGGRHLQEGARC